MRTPGVILVLLGILMLVVGAFNGCGSLFTWNGKHAIAVVHIPSAGDGRSGDGGAGDGPKGDGGAEVTYALVPFPGRRYTLSLEVVFDREGLAEGPDGTVVEAKIPFVVRAKDTAGTSLAEATGWLDPGEPPNVLYGAAGPGSQAAAARHARGPASELVVARLVGPFGAASASPIAIYVKVGADRVGRAHILSRRLVVHDDALPGTIRSGLFVAGAGAVVLLGGLAVLVVAWFRRPSRPRPRKTAA